MRETTVKTHSNIGFWKQIYFTKSQFTVHMTQTHNWQFAEPQYKIFNIE